MSVGDMSVGDMSVGDMSVADEENNMTKRNKGEAW